MPGRTTGGVTKLEWIRNRYESTEKKCPTCGYVDDEGNWVSETNGRELVYRHACPRCGSTQEHTFDLST